MPDTEYTAKHFSEDKAAIRAAYESGKRTITLRGVELTLKLQTKNATWQTGTPRGGKLTNDVKTHHQKEEWIIAKPKDKFRFVPVFSVERRNNMRSSVKS
jgi:hypothetical protein